MMAVTMLSAVGKTVYSIFLVVSDECVLIVLFVRNEAVFVCDFLTIFLQLA